MRFALVVIFLCITFIAKSQQDSIALSEEYYRMGMEIFDYEHRKQASELFILSTRFNPKNAKAYFMAGQSIMLSLKKGNSLPYFKKAYELDHKVAEDILFYIGKAYHYSSHFDSALLFYNQFQMQLLRSNISNRSKKKAELNRKIEECYYAKLMIAYPVNVTITNLGESINSEYPDYAPAVDKNDNILIFTTRRPEDNKSVRVASDHEYYEDIFFSTKENAAWVQASAMPDPLNTNYHNASISVSPDGSEILLYSDSNGGDILVTYKQTDGTWTMPVSMQGVNTPYIENSASISDDKQTLYFTSNRPGGFGGTDIYMCTRDSRGRWSNPQNLGDVINTNLDEEAVHISANGKHLYFSSNGHLGMGDLDIFRATFNSSTQLWERPINMGYPLNSVENDIYFVMSGTENIAYFASVREPSLGEEDIYRLDLNKWTPAPYTEENFEEVVNVTEVEKVNAVTEETKTTKLTEQSSNTNTVNNTVNESTIQFKIVVYEGSSNKPLSADLSLTESTDEILQFAQTQPGHYQLDIKIKSNEGAHYKLQVIKPEYLTYSSKYYFVGNALTKSVISDTVRLDKISVNYNRALNVYFDINSDVPKSLDDVRYLEQVMKSSNTIKVEIGGHTDNTGLPEYNVDLSKRRSDAIKKYLVAAGVDESRIATKGYGDTRPIADNINRAGRKLNRRTEFTIIAE